MSSSPWLRLAMVLLAAGGFARAAVVAHYGFDANYADLSGNARHGTLVDTGALGNSGITTAAGAWKFGGGALDLSADRDHVLVPSLTFSSGTPYTYAFWARKAPGDTGGAADWDMVLGKVDSTNFFMALGRTVGLRWRGADSTAQRQADFPSPDDNDWHHHMVSAAAGGILSYYLDGSLIATVTNKLTGFTFDAIGEAYTSASDFDFHGQIDEVWVFDQALGPVEAAGLAQNNQAFPPPSLLLHHPYDTDYSDASGGGRTGTPSGAASLTTATNLVRVGVGALSLDGADASYVTLPAPVILAATQSWSIAFWARRGETGGGRGMVMGERGTTDDFIWLNDNFNGLRFRSSSNQTLDFTAPKDQLFHHYALVANGAGALALHLDGEPAQTLSGNTSLTIDTIGLAYPTTSLHYAFQGGIDDLRIYNGSLSAAAVRALYQLGGNPGGPGASTVQRLRVFLIGGQSNADGRGEIAALPATPVDLTLPQNDIDYVYRIVGGPTTRTTLRPGTSATGQFGPEVTLGAGLRRWLAPDATQRVAIVKYANGGTNLAVDWKAGGGAGTTGDGPQYVIFQQTVSAGLAMLSAAHTGAVITVEGLAWMQGESDEAYANAYGANLAAFVADLRATYGAGLPVVVGRLSQGQTAIAPVPLATLRAAQTSLAQADPLAGLVNTDAYPMKPDLLHFTGAGQISLGYDFADQFAYLLWMAANFSEAQRAGGLAEPEADADGDGARNWDEFISATAPHNPASRLEAGLDPAPAGFSLRHASVLGVNYFVEFRPDPGQPWAPALPAVPGTGALLTRPLPDPGARGQYRVGAQRP